MNSFGNYQPDQALEIRSAPPNPPLKVPLIRNKRQNCPVSSVLPSKYVQVNYPIAMSNF